MPIERKALRARRVFRAGRKRQGTPAVPRRVGRCSLTGEALIARILNRALWRYIDRPYALGAQSSGPNI